MVYINERSNKHNIHITFFRIYDERIFYTWHPRATTRQGKKLNVELSKGKGGGASSEFIYPP